MLSICLILGFLKNLNYIGNCSNGTAVLIYLEARPAARLHPSSIYSVTMSNSNDDTIQVFSSMYVLRSSLLVQVF